MIKENLFSSLSMQVIVHHSVDQNKDLVSRPRPCFKAPNFVAKGDTWGLWACPQQDPGATPWLGSGGQSPQSWKVFNNIFSEIVQCLWYCYYGLLPIVCTSVLVTMSTSIVIFVMSWVKGSLCSKQYVDCCGCQVSLQHC